MADITDVWEERDASIFRVERHFLLQIEIVVIPEKPVNVLQTVRCHVAHS